MKKVINVLRCLVGLDCAEVASLKYIYVALVRSRLDYGSIVYGSAAIKIVFKSNRTSPMYALQVEAGKMLLYLRRKQLCVNYWMNLRRHRDNHPTKTVLQACWERKSTFGWRANASTRELGVSGVLSNSHVRLQPLCGY